MLQTASPRQKSLPRFASLRQATYIFAAVTASLFSGTSSAHAAAADDLTVMPVPSSIQRDQGFFRIGPEFAVNYARFHDERLEAGLDRMLKRLQYTSGVQLPHLAAAGGNAALTIDVSGPGEAVQSLDEDESYKLVVSATHIQLSANTVVGALRGMETLLQLLDCTQNRCGLPAVTVADTPRFRWRGLMIDVGRHFEPVNVIERNLDGMAVVKLNVFHWHLSDDQGFRAESKRFPRLTGMGSNGGFYTQAEMREVVAYARARGIRVVPEFDMPGHTVSWQLGYPELGSSTPPTELPVVFGIHDEALDPTRESTYKFLDAFIGEMAQIFPDSYMHIGGDESNGKAWQANPKIVAFMQSKGLKDTDALQAYFNQRLLPILAHHGKRMIGWDEVLTPGLPKDVAVESWRGTDSLANGIREGYAGILAAPYYLDAMKTSETHYLADPMPNDPSLTPAQQALVLGGEIAMWSEQIDSRTIDSRIWPRAAAIAERFWSPASHRDVQDMYRRLQVTTLELEAVGLTHISGPQAALRSLARQREPVSLQVFASVLEPVSFHTRAQTQHTNALTPLDRLVDAVVPDPPSRYEMNEQVKAVASGSAAAADDERILADRFRSWSEAVPSLTVVVNESPRMADAAPRVAQLDDLAGVGSEALAYLRADAQPPHGWEDRQLQIITDAEKPVALVNFTFLPALRALVQAAAQHHTVR
jgi:hexosaminidase